MKKVLALIAALVVATLAFAGCGGSQSSSSSSSSAAQTSGTKTLKVGATAVPHAEILEAAKPLLEKEGIKLDIVEFNDYVQPNLALNDKELDANFYQHDPYLQNFMEEHKEVKLVSAGGVHIEPMGIYSKKVNDLKDLKDGATISIPNDPDQRRPRPAPSRESWSAEAQGRRQGEGNAAGYRGEPEELQVPGSRSRTGSAHAR